MQSQSIRAVMLSAASLGALGFSLATGSGAPALAQNESLVQDRVVVTGSRIARRDFQANSPIVTLDSTEFENRSSFAVEAALNQLPQFTAAGSESLASSAGTPFPVASAAPGAATLNLRGLGANRNLILVNGRRAQPVSATMLVDINSIPSAAIQNVEVITGGAASVYGADAVAGVVNFILRRDFEGVEIDAQYGIAEVGDNKTAQISALIGGNFASGRGNAMFGASWSDRGLTYARKREFYTRAWNDPGTTNDGGLQNVSIIRITGIAGGTRGVNPDGTLFLSDRPFDPAAPFKWPLNAGPAGSGFAEQPGGVGFGAVGYNDPNRELTVPLTRYSAFGSAHYQINDNINFFLEGNFTETRTEAQSLVPQTIDFWTVTVPYDPANDDPASPTFGNDPTTHRPVSAELAALLNSRGVPDAPWNLSIGLDFLGQLRTITTTTIYQITSGFRGNLPVRDWTWEVYGSHGQTTVNAGNWGVSQAKLQQLLNGIGSDGVTVTSMGPWMQGWNVGAGQIAVSGSCTSGIPLFNPDGSVPQAQIQVSQDCIEWAGLRMNNVTSLSQNIVEGTLEGGVFDLPAGEVRFAAGATYREVDFWFNPDAAYSAQQNRADVVGLISLPQYGEGYVSVKEVFGELLIPVIRDVPLIQQFNVELGGRYSDYNTAGGVKTFKVLGDWSVNDWLRFRGGYQRANRAPNVYELFAPAFSAIEFHSGDPCSNFATTPAYGNVAGNPNRVNLQLACAELIVRDGGYAYQTLADDPSPADDLTAGPVDETHISNFRWSVLGYNVNFPLTLALEQGNPNLESEEAETWTLGTVITSPFQHALLDRLSLSVDWYSIDLSGAIARVGFNQAYSQCLDPQYNELVAAPAGSVTGAAILANSPFCDLIMRQAQNEFGAIAPGSGRDRQYRATFVNQGGIKTSGIDIQVNWGAEFEDVGLGFIPGGFNWNVVTSILLGFKEAALPGAPFIDYKGTVVNSAYKYQVLSTFNWFFGDANLGLRTRYLPSINPAPTAAPGTTGASSYTLWDMFARYRLSDTYEVRAGVDNLFDRKPNIVGSTATNNALSTTNQNYDTIGRRFYIGATARF